MFDAVTKKGKVSFKRSEEVGVPFVTQQSSRDSNESSVSSGAISDTSSM